jgi:hypothetical protein
VLLLRERFSAPTSECSSTPSRTIAFAKATQRHPSFSSHPEGDGMSTFWQKRVKGIGTARLVA